MALGFGHQAWMGFGTEGTYGTPATRSKFIEFNGEDLAQADDVIASNSVYSVETDVDNVKQGQKSVGGNTAFDMRFEGAELIFKHALGTVSSSAVLGTLAYKHTFSLADTLPTGLTLEIDRGAANFIYDGCKPNSLSLTQDNAGILECSVDWIAEDEGTVSTSTPTFSTTKYPEFDDLVVVFKGTTQTSTAFSFTLDNNLTNDRYQHGSRLLKEPQRAGRLAVTGEMTVEFADVNNWTQFTEAGTGQLTATWTGATISGTAKNEFKVICPKTRLSGGTPAVSDSGIVSASVPFVAYSDGTAVTSRSMQIEWTNTQSSV